MKDQLKKTFSGDASRNIPTKNENVIKAEDTFLTEGFSQMTIEEGFNTEQEYNPFRSTYSQQTYDQELDTYYTTNNNLKGDQHKITWNKYNKHDEKIHETAFS